MCNKIMGLVGLLPALSKITLCICLSHFWIIVCALMYVKLEGFDTSKQTYHQVDKYLNKTISTNTKLVFNKEFKDGYDNAVRKQNYWRKRREFNDMSKAYVFVLAAHTTIGNIGMSVQTWESRLFYFLTVPIGLLVYFLMLHQITVELFEVVAYSAVTFFPRSSTDWTIDQRDLYEKLKVTILTMLMVIILIFLLALLSLLSGDSYLAGLAWALDLVLTINASPDFVSFKTWDDHIVATVLTFIYFLGMLFLYMVIYSLFILFRYNTFDDLITLFQKMNDLDYLFVKSDDDLDSEDIQQQQQSLLYFQSKMSSQNTGSALPEFIYPQIQPASFQVSDEAQILTDDNEEVLHVPVCKKKKRRSLLSKLVLSKEEMKQQDSIDVVPVIEVTQATPSPPYHDDDKSSVSSFDSDYTNISTSEFLAVKQDKLFSL